MEITRQKFYKAKPENVLRLALYLGYPGGCLCSNCKYHMIEWLARQCQ